MRIPGRSGLNSFHEDRVGDVKIEEVGVVGAGIVGLAHAWSASRRGHRVTVFERDAAAAGASIRNFGMVWPIGQPAGEAHAMALRSRQAWLELARDAGLWVNPAARSTWHTARTNGPCSKSLRAPRPASVTRVSCSPARRSCAARAAANPDGLLGGLFSPTELGVNPRAAIRTLARLARQSPGRPVRVRNDDHERRARARPQRRRPRAGLSTGRSSAAAPISRRSSRQSFALPACLRCKLQMLKTVPQPEGWSLGPHLASGLTLRHYANFAVCGESPRPETSHRRRDSGARSLRHPRDGIAE